jgi:hypothetical protein
MRSGDAPFWVTSELCRNEPRWENSWSSGKQVGILQVGFQPDILLRRPEARPTTARSNDGALLVIFYALHQKQKARLAALIAASRALFESLPRRE